MGAPAARTQAPPVGRLAKNPCAAASTREALPPLLAASATTNHHKLPSLSARRQLIDPAARQPVASRQRAFPRNREQRRRGASAGPIAEDIFARRQLATSSANMAYFTGYTMCEKLQAVECDAHAVFGIATSDGGYAVAGKYMVSDPLFRYHFIF